MTPPDAPPPDAPAVESAPPPADVAGVARATVDVAAAPERVFRALTDGAERLAWWAPDAPAGVPADPPAEYRVFDPPRTIEHATPAGRGGRPGVVRYDLVPVDVDGAPGTRVTVTHTVPHAAARAVARAGPALRAGAGPAWLARRPAPAWAARAAARA
jgi:uncharacterized protein YndB with AHSA1/START domain